jgi:uncharacterized protein
MTLLITGGTGLIGTHLARKLREKNYDVAFLGRTKKLNPEFPTFVWGIDKNEIEEEALERCEYIIHLAGANISDKRWSKSRKQKIIDSRVKTTQLLFEKSQKYAKGLKGFITSSAIGYYGTMSDNKVFNETDPPGHDFLAETCRLWEEAADQFKKSGIRTVKIRTGVVLSATDGALQKMLMPVKLGLGSPLGNGKQSIPWIHIDDLCNIYIKAIDDSQMVGAYNATAPDFKTNKEFTEMLAHILNRPFWFPNVPVFLLKLMFGEMSDIILKGNHVSSDKIINAGFNFRFPVLEDALKNLLGDKKTAG